MYIYTLKTQFSEHGFSEILDLINKLPLSFSYLLYSLSRLDLMNSLNFGNKRGFTKSSLGCKYNYYPITQRVKSNFKKRICIFFIFQASAEEELYQKWKELSLNGSDNPAKYRVWDYPIREQYTHILQGNILYVHIFSLLDNGPN